MAKLAIFLLFLLHCFLFISGIAKQDSIAQSATIQNAKQVVEASFSETISTAQAANSFASKTSPADPGVKDCIEQVSSAVDEFNDSIKELGFLGGSDQQCNDDCHLSNIQTYVSAALTYSSDCTDGLDDELKKQKSSTLVTIRAKYGDLEDAVKNSLSLFCQQFGKCK
ncbi:pectinesterase inhibitor 11 [Manihot esculenta]|uniref:Pectinesterase inhibitor domain-containing protein n=1 Tax=Manihot esculenta TaxID=3983 RepID=A0A2C9V4H3_MANES|nr:pectinesterase inhibitor 11 [Manihot esculenta]OAY38668.1 hypothetical protein MANES_10G033800v8 [Manihot esculenta]